MSDGELFTVMDVEVALKPEDMPGKPTRRVVCELCGEPVQDMREVVKNGKVLCRSCDGGGYYNIRR
jgi:formylmethanofuran dehydrogenase subunit E